MQKCRFLYFSLKEIKQEFKRSAFKVSQLQKLDLPSTCLNEKLFQYVLRRFL